MQNISKDVLIEASKGNVEAFEEIYRIASGLVYTVAFRITNSREDAEDITQDVFLKIYKSLTKFRFRSSFKTWVYKVAATTALNVYRKKSKERGRRGNYDIALESARAPDKIREIIEREDNERLVASLLDILNPEQRACITLRDIEGLSYQEISAVLGININTVRSRLKRARLALLTHRKEVVRNEL